MVVIAASFLFLMSSKQLLMALLCSFLISTSQMSAYELHHASKTAKLPVNASVICSTPLPFAGESSSSVRISSVPSDKSIKTPRVIGSTKLYRIYPPFDDHYNDDNNSDAMYFNFNQRNETKTNLDSNQPTNLQPELTRSNETITHFKKSGTMEPQFANENGTNSILVNPGHGNETKSFQPHFTDLNDENRQPSDFGHPNGVNSTHPHLIVHNGTHTIHPHFHLHNGTYHSQIVLLDIEVILASRRLVHNYVACLVDIRPCTHEGDELKKILPDALATRCSKCSARQKAGAKKVIATLQSRYPQEWRILRARWDLDRLNGVL